MRTWLVKLIYGAGWLRLLHKVSASLEHFTLFFLFNLVIWLFLSQRRRFLPRTLRLLLAISALHALIFGGSAYSEYILTSIASITD